MSASKLELGNLTGRCQCESVQYRISGEPKSLYACHCRLCQQQSSSAFGLSLIINDNQLVIETGGEFIKKYITRGDSGTEKHCHFCSECGTRLFHVTANGTGWCSLKAGLLDNIHELVPVAHIWTNSALPWLELGNARFICIEENPDASHELERRWHDAL